MTIELLREFHDAKPGLLTRGHGRATRENLLVLNQNPRMPLSLTGDEAQLYIRSANVPIGIGAERFTVGQQLLEAADVRMLFLDDGFQHRQLERNFDLVLIDSLRPFGGGHLVPSGRLREPLDGLARADAFVLTRADEVPNGRAIESVLRKHNLTAPVFHARTIARSWRNTAGGEFAPDEFNDRRTVAFCGLGNPQAFWRTLRHLGLEPLASYEYDDHHQYTPAEIRRLARHARDVGADVLLTTAKDAVNLDPDYRSIIGDLKLFWLEIGMEIERRADLVSLIANAVSHQAAD
jgi:tetraacyldisaccharide 4'-kinase